MQPGNGLGKETGDVNTGIPFPFQEVLLVHRIGPDNPVKEAFPVGVFKEFYGFAGKEGKADGTDDIPGTLILEKLHGLEQGSAGAEHVVGHKDGFPLDIAEEFYFGDIAVQGILANPGIVPLLVQQGKGFFKTGGIELVPVNGSRIGGNHHKVVAVDVGNLGELADDLVTGMEVSM